MNLAFTAAPLEPFDTNDNHNIGQKRKIMQQQQQSSQNNKTRKQIHTSNSDTFIDNAKVNSVLASIHKGYADADADDEDDDNYLNNHTQPLSASSEKPLNRNKVAKIEKMTNQSDVFGDGLVPLPLEKNYTDLQKLENNYMNDQEVEQYYKKILPNYEYKDATKKHSQNNQNKNYINDPMVNKLNYIIDLLEESKDQRTNNTTEELVLYSFLGVFIIFIVDGFTRVGKYVR
jgi:hypothetical protein